MNPLAVTLAAVVLAAPVALTLPQDPAPARPTEHHEWLGRLVGEWTVRAEAVMGPDAEKMTLESRDTARAIGGLWVQREMRGSMMGTEVHALMTLGYDEKKKAFVGTWIDSMQSHMWHYEGKLDAAKKVLTLSASGPSFDDPDVMANYHDIITIVDADTHTLTSEVQTPDGKWTPFMTARYERKK